jgi:hypothetical protein
VNNKPISHRPTIPSRHIILGLFLLSAATLAFEIDLTRLFSVGQFYHFAFMIVSIALLGFGASGTVLASIPNLGQSNPKRSMSWLSLATAFSILAAYILTNQVPFDSFSVMWDPRQVGILIVHYIALATPFFFTGMAVGLILTAFSQSAGRMYAINLSGSALGCVIALIAPGYIGGEGTVVLSSAMAGFATLLCLSGQGSRTNSSKGLTNDNRRRVKSNRITKVVPVVFVMLLLIISLVDIGLRLSGRASFNIFDLHLSPYKSLSYALQYPGAKTIDQKWNAFSRVDVVQSTGIRSLPGLSYRYLQPPPPENGLLVDGDDLSPIILEHSENTFLRFLPAAIAYELRPDAKTLILEPRGGLDVLIALGLGASQVTVVEVNPLIVDAGKHIYENPLINLVIESDRSFTRQSDQLFDIIVLSLGTSYHPVRSGAYSLVEDYRYTTESFQDALNRLKPDGVMVVTRWLQNPPSESLRAFAIGVTALEYQGFQAEDHILAFRGYNTATMILKNKPFTGEELTTVEQFTQDRAFDLVYAPGLDPGIANQYNILPNPIYYQTFAALLNTHPRKDFYQAYPFDVSPPVDDHPFFGHYFKWTQAGQVFAELGKVWQPFGGAGYFVILALLVIATSLAIFLILAPAAYSRLHQSSKLSEEPIQSTGNSKYLVYFGFIGMAFLLVEIPLIQRFILFLGHPSYALTTVLFTLLLFSGIGSRLSHRLNLPRALGILVITIVGLPAILPLIFNQSLGFMFAYRLVLTVILLAPLGFLMGIPFPGGIRWILNRNHSHGLIPWVWGVNGAASVVAAVLAALIALSFGFNWVFSLGAFFYAAAWVLIMAVSRQTHRSHLPP